MHFLLYWKKSPRHIMVPFKYLIRIYVNCLTRLTWTAAVVSIEKKSLSFSRQSPTISLEPILKEFSRESTQTIATISILRNLRWGFRFSPTALNHDELASPRQVLFHEMAVAGWKKMKRVDQVKPSEEEIKFIFEIIDIDGDGKITLMEATKSAQLLKDRFGVTEVKVK